MSTLGSDQNPLRVAVVGSGPSGFYAAEALLRSEIMVQVDMIERLPAPYGLVRYGVAPDHPKLKQSIQVYDKIAQTPQFSYFGNVTVGRDVSVDELRTTHHAVVFACGAESDRRLGIDGEDLSGSHTATEFVGWYNGHPDYTDRVFDLSHETAVIIGQGNVAADVARILAKTVDELKTTDIASHALEVLADSRIEQIYVIGRRGPAQAKFTPKELREFGELEDCVVRVDADELTLNAATEEELKDKKNVNGKKNVELFRGFSEARNGKRRRCQFAFLRSPRRIEGDGRVRRIVLEHNELEGPAFAQSARGSGRLQQIECGIVFRSIGYFGVPMDGVPFDERRGVFANDAGRIVDGGEPVPGLYTAGWIKRGPTGIIGTNRADAVATIASLIEDLPRLDIGAPRAGGAALTELLERRGVRVVSYPDWQRLDAIEIERGAASGKPREKIVSVDEMLAAL